MKKFSTILLFVVISMIANSQEMSFKVNVTTLPNGNSQWDITADKENIKYQSIKKIIYNLDGMLYKDPIREITNSDNAFQLILQNSKESKVDAEVYYDNSKVSKVDITLNKKSDIALELNNTATKLKSGLYEWEAFISGNASDIAQIEHVDYKLHSSFKEPFRSQNQIGNINKPFMIKAKGWSVFKLKADVFLRNGKSISLEHVLQFNKLRVVVFYLASNQAITKPKAEEIVNALRNQNNYQVELKTISDNTNKKEGYNLSSNEIRYELIEATYANEIISTLKESNISTTLEKNIITYSSPEYLSIFIVK